MITACAVRWSVPDQPPDQCAEKGEFNLIFMDIQMPIMNGIEATKAIRKLEDPWASGIPISFRIVHSLL